MFLYKNVRLLAKKVSITELYLNICKKLHLILKPHEYEFRKEIRKYRLRGL